MNATFAVVIIALAWLAAGVWLVMHDHPVFGFLCLFAAGSAEVISGRKPRAKDKSESA